MLNYQQVFLEEAHELLSDLETQLLELEIQPDNHEIVGQIFRALHTIKGSGAMFGFDKVSAFTHNLENVFDLVRNNKLNITPELIDLALKSRDYIYRLLQSPDSNAPELDQEGVQLSLLIQSFLPAGKELSEKENLAQHTQTANNNARAVPHIYYISFAPPPDLFKMGINPFLLLNELRELGDFYAIANMEDVPGIEQMDPESCYTKWDLILVTDQQELAIRDIFIFVEDISKLIIHDLGVFEKMTSDQLQQLLKNISNLETKDKPGISRLLKTLQPNFKPEKNVKSDNTSTSNHSSLRVASKKLDELVDLVGEFVTKGAHFTQLAKSLRNAESILLAEQMERLTNELRENVMSLRMQPIGTVFGKFKRLVRDLSVELNKNVTLETEGEKTELDKSVIEKLNDPIMHIIRNSIDHGIEPPPKRKELGKPEKSTINLSAFHSGANVIVKIKDDGKGLDKKEIFKKAVKQSMISSDQQLSDDDIYQLIMQPGFSTNQNVTKVSGRGVGMDVVKKTIDSLGGTVVINTTPGDGTEIKLVLPLTLAIIEGLLVTIQNEYFIFPLSIVEECVEMNIQEAKAVNGRHLTNVRGELVPYFILRDYFDLTETPPKTEQIVITNIYNQKFGFVVDSVIGSYQTVIKSLGQMYKKIEGISGATILGDGSVALILDLIKLEKAAKAELEEP